MEKAKRIVVPISAEEVDKVLQSGPPQEEKEELDEVGQTESAMTRLLAPEMGMPRFFLLDDEIPVKSEMIEDEGLRITAYNDGVEQNGNFVIQSVMDDNESLIEISEEEFKQQTDQTDKALSE